MKFLLDANMPRSAADVARALGHEVEDVRDVLPMGAEDSAVAAYAAEHGHILVTRDFDFADIRNYSPQAYAGIVVLQLADDASAAMVVRCFESFIENPDLLARLPRRLAIVETWRARFRPHGPVS
jgi:predicted nuclease of predicted toxin-antitoxin system